MPSLRGVVGSIYETRKCGSVEIEWKLRNFFSLSAAVGDFYHSPSFSVSGRSFCLQLYPNGECIRTSKCWIALYLTLKDTYSTIDVMYTLAIKKADEYTKHLADGFNTFSKEGQIWGANKALERAELLQKRQELAPSDILTITATLEMGVPHPIEEFDMTILGKLRQGHCTQVCKEVFWEIDDALRRLGDKEGFECWSPPFMFGPQEGQMSLYINDDRTEIRLFMASSIPGYFRWKAGILRTDGKEEWTGSGQTLLQEDRPDRDPFGVWCGPSRGELIRQKVALIPGGVLNFFLLISKQKAVEGATDISIMKPLKSSVGENRIEELQTRKITGLTSLSRNLKDLYVSGKDCDVTLKANGKKFHAHRLILGARSPVLAAMFSNNMVEAETGFLCVEDCHPEAFGVFLMFVYSGVVENLTGKIATNVYYIADKYDVPALKEVCVQHMLSTLGIDSVCSILALASRHGEELLLQNATEFFLRNAQEVFRTAAWSKFMIKNTSLANELIIQSHQKVK